MKKLFFAGLLAASTVAHSADLGLSPSSLKLKVYKFAVSASENCTNLITVVDNGNDPQEVEFVGSVNLGSGSVANGTYPCVVVEFSDVIKFTPDANSDSGSCLTSDEEQLDVCRNDHAGTSLLIDGSTTTCGVAGTADRVAMYISTGTNGNDGDVFNPPTVANPDRGLNLAGALVISGDSIGKFIVNGTGKVCDGDDGACGGNPGSCEMQPPTFGFSEI